MAAKVIVLSLMVCCKICLSVGGRGDTSFYTIIYVFSESVSAGPFHLDHHLICFDISVAFLIAQTWYFGFRKCST